MMKILNLTLILCLLTIILSAQQDSLAKTRVVKLAKLTSQVKQGVSIVNVEQVETPDMLINSNGSRSANNDVYIEISLRQVPTPTTPKTSSKKKVVKTKKRKHTRGRLYAYKPKKGLFVHCPSF